jgi:hypothetical protein
MQYSDTTNKNGLLQECEFWTALGDAVISGDTTLKAQFTSRLNRGYDAIMPLLLSYGDKMRFDDTNHTKHPIGTTNLVSGTRDYQILSDEQGNSILNITDVMIYQSSTSTEYKTLRRMTLDDPLALRAMSPNPTDTGIPYAFLEKDNTVFLYPQPNYSATNGIKFFFERNADYFVTSDTTQTPGIPIQFHQLLALHASLDWLLVYKSEATTLIDRIEKKIAKKERDLERATNARSPVRRRIASVGMRSI